MKSNSILLTGILLIGCTILSFAQDNDEITIEDLYLSNPEVVIIREQSLADDRQTKQEALKGIEQMLENGTATADIEKILIYLGSEGTAIKRYEGRTVTNNFPEIRSKACLLLGKYGGENAVSALINILRHEEETMVMSEAAYALGIIGNDENGKVSRVLAETIELQTVVNPDSNLAYAVILALQKIAEANRGLNDSAGYRALITIAQGNYLKGVKRMAIDTLKGMKKYN